MFFMSQVIKKRGSQDQFHNCWDLGLVGGYLLLSFKKHDSVCYLAQLMLALQCNYVERSHRMYIKRGGG